MYGLVAALLAVSVAFALIGEPVVAVPLFAYSAFGSFIVLCGRPRARDRAT